MSTSHRPRWIALSFGLTALAGSARLMPLAAPEAWRFAAVEGALEAGGLTAPQGPLRFAPEAYGGGLLFNSESDLWRAGDAAAVPLPRGPFTVTAWVAVERPERWGGIAGRLEDNGNFEKGWLLGYDEERFTFALATAGADDGDGKVTYLRGRAAHRYGAWRHVAATYDGAVMRLYVDGVLDAESSAQSGAVLYADFGEFVVGGYRDRDEHHPLDGRLAEVTLRAGAASAEALAAEADHPRRSLPAWDDIRFDWLVRPYLTWPTTDAISIGCEATEPATLTLRYRRDDEPEWRVIVAAEARALHTVRLPGLLPDQKYFYEVTLTSAAPPDAPREPDEPVALTGPIGAFRTAASTGQAFTFAVVGDTQTNGKVARRIADLIQEQRPNFLVLAGDLVDTGSAKSEWTDYFFRHLGALLANVPLMPVLGNHEQDACHYYDYMDLPAPERWYSFTYGDAEFFMLDGNRSLADQSEQLSWLQSALARSRATWRFAVLHQPPYTSDSDDYGDTLTGPSTRGDLNVRNIVGLLEQYGVDICFSGHVHDYERTFPIQAGRVVPYEDGGVLYITAAGGGGRLEDFDPVNTSFGFKKVRRHHFVQVALHGRHLELHAVDEEGRLFDVLTLTKRPQR